jgi:hypothetical protein
MPAVIDSPMFPLGLLAPKHIGMATGPIIAEP